MVYSTYKKLRILYLHSQGFKAPTITKMLAKEKLKCSRVGVAKVYEATGSIARRPGSGRPSKITAEIKDIVEEQMRLDDETTAYQLHRLLTDKGYSISLRTILRCRTALGWTFPGSAYCQLIRDVNKVKRLAWALTIALTMSSGRMSVLFRWRAIDVLPVESVERLRVRSQGKYTMYTCTTPTCMYIVRLIF